jgi:hypothetical protein
MLDMRKGVCALCHHDQVIDAPALEYSDESPIRLAVTHAPDSLEFFDTKQSIDRPLGLLRILVCRACGYVQWFASRPEKIPVDEAHGTRLVKPAEPR